MPLCSMRQVRTLEKGQEQKTKEYFNEGAQGQTVPYVRRVHVHG